MTAFYHSLLKMERPSKAAIIITIILAGNSFWLWRVFHHAKGASPITSPDNVLPHAMHVGDPIPGISGGAYYGGWYHDQKVLNVLVTDTPHNNHASAFRTHQEQYPLLNTSTAEYMHDDTTRAPSNKTRLQARAHDRPNFSGWDHCTLWPVNPSLSGCTEERGLGPIYKAAGSDHTRALLQYLLNFCFDPVPEKIKEWPIGFQSGCITYRGATICLSWPDEEAPPEEGRPFVPAIKRLLLDYTMTCAQEGKSAQHLVAIQDKFRTICVSGEKRHCRPNMMGCHAKEHAEKIAKCRNKKTFNELPAGFKISDVAGMFMGED